MRCATKTDYVLLIMNQDGLKGVLEDKFELGGEIGVAAGPVGREAAAIVLPRPHGRMAIENERPAVGREDAAVRAEYRHVPDDLFRAGRAAVLRALADQERLFHTPEGRARYESAARRNLAGELAALTA